MKLVAILATPTPLPELPMNTRCLIAVLVASSIVGVSAGCKSSGGASAKRDEQCIPADSAMAGKPVGDARGKIAVVNAKCPVMPAHAVAGKMASPECVVEYKGKKVGFCCDDCVPQWEAMSEAEKAAALAKAM